MSLLVRVITMLTAAATLSLTGGCRKYVSKHEIEATTSRLLPPGTTVERAILVLDSLHVPHSPYDRRFRHITARCGTSSEDWLVTGEVFLELWFDERGLLARREVSELFTGP